MLADELGQYEVVADELGHCEIVLDELEHSEAVVEKVCDAAGDIKRSAANNTVKKR